MQEAIIAGVLVGIPLYLLPTIVAYKRQHRQRVSILTLNIFLGWSIFGWVGSLVWALATDQREIPPPRIPPAGTPATAAPRPAGARSETVTTAAVDDVDESPEEFVAAAALYISRVVENTRTRTIRWRDASGLLDEDIRRRASRAGVLNPAGDALTEALDQGLLMLLDSKAPDARVTRTTEPIPDADSFSGSDDEAATTTDSPPTPRVAEEPASAEPAPELAASAAASPAEKTSPERPDSQLVENLESLIRMHERGILSDAELEAAKRRLLQ